MRMKRSEFDALMTKLSAEEATAMFGGKEIDLEYPDGRVETTRLTFVESAVSNDNNPGLTLDEVKRIVDSAVKAASKPVKSPPPPVFDNDDFGFTGRKSKVFKSDRTAENFGEFVKSILPGRSKTLTTNVDTDGGYLVPEQFLPELIDLANSYGVIRQNARVVTMTSDTLRIPRVVGRPTLSFVGEALDGSASQPSFDSVGLTAKKVLGLTPWSRELAEDSPIALADWVGREFARQSAYTEDNAGFNGDGTSTYGGIDGIVNRLTVVNGVDDGGGIVLASGNLWSEITLGDFHNAIARTPSYALRNARWYASPSFWASVMQRLAFAAGGVSADSLLGGARAQSFLGYPVVLTEVMPTTQANSQICALFGDLSQAVTFGDRRMPTIEIFNSGTVGNVNLLTSDSLALRFSERFDINVNDIGSSTVAGPVVGLMTQAS